MEPDKVSPRTSPAIIISLLVILLGSFFVRAYHPLSRSDIWPNRAMRFLSAVEDRAWDQTYQNAHPGVTVMAVGALTYYIFDQVDGTIAENFFLWGSPSWVTPFGEQVAIGMIGLAFVSVLLLLAITLTLRRLGGWPLAITALVLVGFSPFYLAQSRVFHVDALVATLMLLSALLMLLFLKQGSWVYLILSGLAGGLSLLTKSPAVFLIPYAGLGLLLYAGIESFESWSEHSHDRVLWLTKQVARNIAAPLLIWLLSAAFVVSLWPALWDNPLEILNNVFFSAAQNIENPHSNPRYFAGQIYKNQPPPVTYYPTSLLFRTTFITLLFMIFSILMMTVWRKRRQSPVAAPTYWLLVAYVVFFTIQMTISAKQVDRYVLPAQMMLDVIAATGLVGAAKLITASFKDRLSIRPQALSALVLAIPLTLHLLVTLPFFPDFGAHYNYLLGGNRGAASFFSFQGQEEGVFEIVRYMQEHPEIHLSKAGGFGVIWQQFDVNADETGTPTHELISVVDVRRGRIDTDRLVVDYADQEPELTVTFDNVIYLWLYPIEPVPDVTTIHIKRGWAGFTVVAWIATAVIVLVLVLALRRPAPQLSSAVDADRHLPSE